jgi:hypothetical protein
MLLASFKQILTECDGCGVRGHGAAPRGWFDRPLDPPYYTGPRRLLFCPRCFAALPAAQQRRWRRLGQPRSALRMVTIARPFLRIPPLPKRRSVG